MGTGRDGRYTSQGPSGESDDKKHLHPSSPPYCPPSHTLRNLERTNVIFSFVKINKVKPVRIKVRVRNWTIKNFFKVFLESQICGQRILSDL